MIGILELSNDCICMGISSDVLIYGEDKGWSGNLDFWEIWCGFLKNPRQQCPKNKNLDPEHIRTPKIIEIGLETMENDHFEDGCILIQIFFKNLDFSDRQNVDLLKALPPAAGKRFSSFWNLSS